METYQVKPGDSLSKISQLKYGDFSMVDEIARLNNIANVNLIMPGQVLRLPEVQEAEVTVLDQNGNPVSTAKKFPWPFLIGGLVVAFGIGYVVTQQKKKGKSLIGIESKKRFKKLKYEPGSGTIRSVPENYWLASVKEDGTIVFDSWDRATEGRIDKKYIRNWFKKNHSK